ncbi:hypothetical protein PIB30_108023, partial [Stylosanthes scabra]|nr:hypothetical protein [Stylosanthes scabra]
MTTGRINQVAILGDVVHRSGLGSPWARVESVRARASFRKPMFCKDSWGRHHPRIRSMHCIRENSRSSWAIVTVTNDWMEHEAYFIVLRRPSRDIGWKGHITRDTYSFNQQPDTRASSIHPRPCQAKATMRRIAGRPFDAQARSQPTRTIESPLTRLYLPQNNTTKRTTPRMQKGMRANGHVEWHRSSAARHAQHGAMQMQKHLVLKTML